MGSITERPKANRRKNGRNLLARQYMPDGTRASASFKERSEAKQWIKKMEAKARRMENEMRRETSEPAPSQSSAPDGTGRTVGDALVLYEQIAPATLAGETTWSSNYGPSVRRWKAHPFAALPIDELYTDQIKAWVADERLLGRPYATIRSRLRPLRLAIDMACERWRLTIRNPAEKIRLGKDEQRRRRPYPDEKQALLNAAYACDNRTLYWAMRWSAECGMRRKECARSRASFISEDSQGLHIKTGPTKTSSRSFLMWDALIDLHREIYADIGAHGLLLGGVRPDSITQAFTRVRDEVGVSHAVTFHSFRAEAVSWMTEAGLPESLIMQIVGHASLEMTNHYTHFSSASVTALNQATAKRDG